jgi:peptidylprolyl isomerase
MRAANASLESKYTPWGRVVSGLEVVRKLKVGEPPADPDKMVRVRVLADLPANERPTLQALDTRSATFRAAAERAKAEKKDAFDPCELEIAVRVTPPA